ncbi:8167_t:CDS:2 [Cetraspora pellucida]|uniref:8167_t:CDS:1 n=1 Tax=Cetraspora pellucida TaxID=1433469 RepID=A0ACA9PC30_9GLOM|nr:8167_t:CDS:2 [Cetraspora pellucida]
MSATESSASKKRKERSAITLEKKVEIIKKKEKNAKLSHQDLAKQYSIDRSTPTILLADNCAAHSSPKLRNIKLEFLPSHTTSVIQPCDARIIKNFKANYHKLLVTKWINNIENRKSFEPINVKEAIYLISDAWKQVVLTTIINCWNKIKILTLEMNLTNKTAEEYVNMDNKLQMMDTLTEESVVKDILKEQGLGKMALEVAKKYLEQSQFATEDDIYLL